MNFIKCILYLALIGMIGFIIGRLLPKKLFCEDVYPYKQFRFEKDGKIYELFQIRKWKDKLLDMSRIFPKIMPVKRLHNVSSCNKSFVERLPVLIEETCIAEFIHSMLSIAGFGCMVLWKEPGGFIVSILYALGNIPFIMVQRYNRPRFIYMMSRRAECSKSKQSYITNNSYSSNFNHGYPLATDEVRLSINVLAKGENTAESNMLYKSHK